MFDALLLSCANCFTFTVRSDRPAHFAQTALLTWIPEARVASLSYVTTAVDLQRELCKATEEIDVN
jgi:hypothetical protein